MLQTARAGSPQRVGWHFMRMRWKRWAAAVLAQPRSSISSHPYLCPSASYADGRALLALALPQRFCALALTPRCAVPCPVLAPPLQLLDNEATGLRAMLRDDRREDLGRVYRCVQEYTVTGAAFTFSRLSVPPLRG
jgi:hypothetical protein